MAFGHPDFAANLIETKVHQYTGNTYPKVK